MNITIGADPEVFVKQGGKHVSAHGLIPGTKEEPYPVEYGAVQVDGMALEFNIDPAVSEHDFLYNVQAVMAQLDDMVPDHELSCVPVAHFGKEYIDAQPDEAKELGCDPDFNAWTGKINEKPNGDLPFRTAAGHIHIGWTEGVDIRSPAHIERCRKVVRQMDFYLGLPSLFYDTDTQRRGMYGEAGAYRVKPYGVEYRTLSNAWLTSPELIRWAFSNAVAGVESLKAGENLVDIFGDVQEVINTSDVFRAAAILADTGIIVPKGVDYVGQS